MVILNVLCEGQTEDRFVSSVLKEYLKKFDIVVKHTILVTNKKKNIRGGILSYQQAKNDLELLIKQHSRKTFEIHFYTTMFDLYALPDDFPGYPDAMKILDCYEKVKKIEEKFAEDIPSRNFIPYIQLHEFEAKEFERFHHYDKPKSGALVTSRVGIEKLKNKCLHFKEWIEKLEKL